MAKGKQGFASMTDRAKQREISRQGGRAAHMKGTARKWSCDEARDAARKGALVARRRSLEPIMAAYGITWEEVLASYGIDDK